MDISTNSLCGVTEAMKYSVNSQTDWVDITGNSAIISEKLKFGDIVYVKAFGDGGISFYDSDIQEIAIKQAESPKYKVIYPTANNPYGQLNFPGSTMQYRKKGESEWNTAKDTINKLTVGNWELRAAPYGEYTAGEVLELNVFTVSDNALLSSIGYELNGESYTLNKYQMELAMTDAGYVVLTDTPIGDVGEIVPLANAEDDTAKVSSSVTKSRNSNEYYMAVSVNAQDNVTTETYLMIFNSADTSADYSIISDTSKVSFPDAFKGYSDITCESAEIKNTGNSAVIVSIPQSKYFDLTVKDDKSLLLNAGGIIVTM